MRQFLYISPYFPPGARVGALRPLKFARHLPTHGWAPVVLCDLWPGARTSTELLDAVPDTTTIVRDYSARAAGAFANLQRPAASPSNKTASAPPSAKGFDPRDLLPQWLNNPELIPLGEHSVHIPHAVGAARRALKAHPKCEAIMVNADPYAALLVGAHVARQTGLPLIQDLRDPWSVCELRRPRRPWPILPFVDWLERLAFRPAQSIILNSLTTLEDYRRHYADFDPQRFACIRNHGDAGLIGHGEHGGFERFSLLFLGHFRRFLEGDVLIEVLVELKRRGLGHVQLVVTGNCPPDTMEMAHNAGVGEMVTKHDFVSYTSIGPVMESADVLVALSNRSTQRIPAKFYDYATSKRPVLVLADNAELGQMARSIGGAIFGMDDPMAVADWLEPIITAGRHPTTERPDGSFSSQQATAELAAILDRITA